MIFSGTEQQALAAARLAFAVAAAVDANGQPGGGCSLLETDGRLSETAPFVRLLSVYGTPGSSFPGGGGQLLVWREIIGGKVRRVSSLNANVGTRQTLAWICGTDDSRPGPDVRAPPRPNAFPCPAPPGHASSSPCFALPGHAFTSPCPAPPGHASSLPCSAPPRHARSTTPHPPRPAATRPAPPHFTPLCPAAQTVKLHHPGAPGEESHFASEQGGGGTWYAKWKEEAEKRMYTQPDPHPPKLEPVSAQAARQSWCVITDKKTSKQSQRCGGAAMRDGATWHGAMRCGAVRCGAA